MKFNLQLVLAFLSMTFSQEIWAQDKYSISGTLYDASNGETMIGASIMVKGVPGLGTSCNNYGYYSLSLEAGTYTLVIRSMGFNTLEKEINLSSNKSLDFKLVPDSQVLGEVVVTGEKEDENLTRTEIGAARLDVKEIEKIPVIFGEKDILKTLQLLPGVNSAGEGNGGFFVRGGSADQNLILLDEAPVYNASHLLGFFSTFNSDALKDVNILKGNSPAQYGGRLSSVLDVKMKEGNNQKHGVSGGIGLISSRLSLEGPIQNDKSSYMVAGRRTYADVFLRAMEEFSDNKLYFYDLNAKANIKINDKNRLYLSGYFGEDVLGFGDDFGIDWGNTTGTLRWSSILGPKVFSNTALIYSDYKYNIELNAGGSDLNINSRIKDWNLKEELSIYPNSKNDLTIGVNAIYHSISPSTFEGGVVTAEEVDETRYSLENAVYINNNTKVNTRLSLDYGLRVSFYHILGEGTYYEYSNGLLTDTTVLASGEFGKTYFNLEPRFQFSYLLNEFSSIKGGYARNTQHLHLLGNSTSNSPTDQWIGNSYTIQPEISDQISLGYFRNFNENKYKFSAETYYKDLQNQIDYVDGADLFDVDDVESQLLFGKGRAYGLELLIKKNKGRFTGWIGYTLSKTERQIDGINNNDWYNARQDRTHDLSIVTMYELNEKWSLSALFVYNTGNAITQPSGKYSIEGNTTFVYSERNGYRMPNYHRLDIGATYTQTHKKNYKSSWNFSLYNAYGRENAFTISFQDDPDDASLTQAIQTSLFRWVPSVTYNFNF